MEKPDPKALTDDQLIDELQNQAVGYENGARARPEEYAEELRARLKRTPVGFAHWIRGEPDRPARVYALVLPDGARVPFVGQYEPKLNQWVSEGGGRYDEVDCVHSPLPPHDEFREETHLTDSWILRALRLERTTDRERLARAKEDLKVYRLRIARALGMFYQPEGHTEQPCTDDEAVEGIKRLATIALGRNTF